MTRHSEEHLGLAAVAARAAASGAPAMLFNVVHFGAGTAPQAKPAGISPPTTRKMPAIETLAFNLAGVGFRLHTWAPEGPSKPIGAVAMRLVSLGASERDSGAVVRKVYAGAVVINPDFRYQTAQRLELLLTVGYRPWKPDYGDSLMIAYTYAAIAAAAGRVEAPILLLQTPVSPYRNASPAVRMDGSGEVPQLNNGMALRMVIGLDNEPARRLALVDMISQVARDIGLGLQVADGRLGRARGEWWTLERPDATIYRERKDDMFGWAPIGLPDRVRLLTFVGPARVGSSAAITMELNRRNIGIIAACEALMQEMSVLNVVVPIAPARQGAGAASGSCGPVVEALGRIASECGLTRRTETRGRSLIGLTAATDYHVASTGPLDIRVSDSASRKDRPLWVTWDLPQPEAERQSDIAHAVLTQLLVAEQVSQARVDYYRATITPTGRVRGRAKIAISFSEEPHRDDIGNELSKLCSWAQREVVSILVRDGLPLRTIRLRIIWRERWLGKANTPL